MVGLVMYRVAQVEEIVAIAGSAGLLAVLDMHQDVFNRFLHGEAKHLVARKYCGNGVPDWAARPRKENFPYPLEVGRLSWPPCPRWSTRWTRTTTPAARTAPRYSGPTTTSPIGGLWICSVV